MSRLLVEEINLGKKMNAVLVLIPILIFFALVTFAALVSAFVRRLGSWNRTYTMVAKRYGGQAYPGYLLSRPSIAFDYGQTSCRVATRKSFRFGEGKMTELVIQWPDKNWPDRKLKLEISSSPIQPAGKWGLTRATQPVEIEGAAFKSKLYISSNRPEVAKRLLTPTVQWQIEQLRRHLGNQQLSISINRGRLLIAKPTFIKDQHLFDDFVRFGLELYDQMVLTECKGIAFVTRDEPTVIDNVTCPICSEPIEQQIVVCVRCKTPHCLDCWQYNGQCATFACNETRYMHADQKSVKLS
jgi:hypothetical protein